MDLYTETSGKGEPIVFVHGSAWNTTMWPWTEIPTLVLCGTDDSLTPQKYSLYLNKAVQGSELLLIEGAGHMVMMENPEAVGRAIREFIRGK
jgi:pimeloyl-ACP methyl ester carboxylesterase